MTEENENDFSKNDIELDERYDDIETINIGEIVLQNYRIKQQSIKKKIETAEKEINIDSVSMSVHSYIAEQSVDKIDKIDMINQYTIKENKPEQNENQKDESIYFSRDAYKLYENPETDETYEIYS